MATNIFSGKKILVCGMARSGQAAATLLVELGALVTVQDKNPNIDWQLQGVQYALGVDPTDIAHNFELIIISPGISVYEEFIEVALSMGIHVWGEAELAYKLCPCPMLAITGTNGKTTVTTLVGQILSLHTKGVVVGGNIGIPLTELVQTLTPQNTVVAEISSFQLETVEAFRPHIAAVLNITEDHIDRHRNMATYIAMKERIFAQQRPSDVCVLNYDNAITRAMQPPGRVVYFSATAQLDEGVYLHDGAIVTQFGGVQAHVCSLLGLHILPENALAATALALCAGVPHATIAQGLAHFAGVPHRLEHVITSHGIQYINDSKATNVDATINALTFAPPPIVLICGGSNKGVSFTPLVQSFAGKVAEVIVFGETAQNIVDTCKQLGFTNYTRANTLQEAVNIAASKAQPGGTVLFSPACASFDMFKNFEQRGNMFKDCVRRLVDEHSTI